MLVAINYVFGDRKQFVLKLRYLVVQKQAELERMYRHTKTCRKDFEKGILMKGLIYSYLFKQNLSCFGNMYVDMVWYIFQNDSRGSEF